MHVQAWEFYFLRPRWRAYLQPFSAARHGKAVGSLHSAVCRLVERVCTDGVPADCFLAKLLDDQSKGKMAEVGKHMQDVKMAPDPISGPVQTVHPKD